MEEALKANTLVTESIKADTGEIVALMKGGRVLGSMLKWASYTGAGLTAIGVSKYLKMW